jgi:hypothetical protein
VNCPILLVHGLQSDALLPSTIERMSRHKDITIMHLPDTGHAPLLADRHQIFFIRDWLNGQFYGMSQAAGQWTVLHAPPRDRHASTAIRFAPKSALR